jgi:hypothetical protein
MKGAAIRHKHISASSNVFPVGVGCSQLACWMCTLVNALGWGSIAWNVAYVKNPFERTLYQIWDHGKDKAVTITAFNRDSTNDGLAKIAQFVLC